MTSHQATSSGPDSSTSSHHQPPPSITAPVRWVTGATSRAAGSTESTNPPVAENHRNPKSRQRALSRSQVTARANEPVATGVGVLGRDLLAEQLPG